MQVYQYPRKPRREPDLTIEEYHFWFNEKIWGHNIWYYEMIPGEWLVYHSGHWEKIMPEWFMTEHKRRLDEAFVVWTIEKQLLNR